MGSKFRPLYDELYMKVEYYLLARESKRRIKERVKVVKTIDNFGNQYKEIVIPYWRKYGIKPKKEWYKVYSEISEEGIVDPRFIPHDILVKRILPYYNSLIFSKTFQDKNYQDIFLKGFKQPTTLVRNISGIYQDGDYKLLEEQETIEKCLNEDVIIIKPSVGTGSAEGIDFIETKNINANQLKEVLHKYGKDFIIQKIIKQHSQMKKLHPNSVNTIRILTFLYEGEVHIVNAFLRIGSGNHRVDNMSKNGYACNILEDGRLDKIALENKGKWVEKSENGIVFGNFKIPNYSKVKKIVKEAALQLAHFRIIGWDIAIDEEGEPIIVEFNLIPISSVDSPQNCCHRPFFGNLTDRVLDEVFLDK